MTSMVRGFNAPAPALRYHAMKDVE